jgi:hypothetical protein
VAGKAPVVVGRKLGCDGAASLKTEIFTHRRSTLRPRIVFNSLVGVKRARILTS